MNMEILYVHTYNCASKVDFICNFPDISCFNMRELIKKQIVGAC